jgi:hypothetical protein
MLDQVVLLTYRCCWKKTRCNNFTTKSGREGAKEVASVHYFVLNMFGKGISFISLPLHFDVF